MVEGESFIKWEGSDGMDGMERGDSFMGGGRR